MAKKYRITGFILAVVLSLICLTFVKKDEVNVLPPIHTKLVAHQLTYIDKHNIFSNENTIKYIGHRGIGGLAPENTLPAFELAGKLGLWAAECDVRTTSDGNWMILHDDTVDRMTDGTGKIKNLSLKKVQSLNISSGKNIMNYKGTKIPKLQDYLLTCKKWGLVAIIEMKPSDNLQYYDKFIKIIKEYGNIEKTVVISSSRTSLNELRKRDIYLPLGLICSDINSSNIYYAKALGNAFIDCSTHKITSSDVTLCHENNIKVGAWTVDNVELNNSLVKKGVDFITTNKLWLEVKKKQISVTDIGMYEVIVNGELSILNKEEFEKLKEIEKNAKSIFYFN